MSRPQGWEAALGAVVARYAGAPQPFVWGQSDCTHFAADCVRAVTGVDVLSEWRGVEYSSRLTAAARLRARGFETLADATAAALAAVGATEIPPEFAMVGDVGVAACGLCVRLPAGFAARSEAGALGVVALPILRAWRI